MQMWYNGVQQALNMRCKQIIKSMSGDQEILLCSLYYNPGASRSFHCCEWFRRNDWGESDKAMEGLESEGLAMQEGEDGMRLTKSGMEKVTDWIESLSFDNRELVEFSYRRQRWEQRASYQDETSQ